MSLSIATVVINLTHRSDRRVDTERELARVGWDATFFPAIAPTTAGDFPSIGARGCFLSHLAVLRQAKERGVDRLIILEDDIAFVPDFRDRWRRAVQALEEVRWSIFYAGHPLDEIAAGISRLPPNIEVRCTHFFMIHGIAIPHIIAGLETILSRPAGHPLGSPMHVDGAYSTIRAQNPWLRTYACFPTLGYQRPSRTDIGEPGWYDRITAIRPLINLLRRGKREILQAKLRKSKRRIPKAT